MDNLAIKPSSIDDILVAKSSISTKILHKPDLSAARSGTTVCPRTQEVTYYRGIVGNVHTIKTTLTTVSSSARNVSVMNRLTSLT